MLASSKFCLSTALHSSKLWSSLVWTLNDKVSFAVLKSVKDIFGFVFLNSSQTIIWDFESQSWLILCSLIFWHIFATETQVKIISQLCGKIRNSVSSLVTDKKTLKCHCWALCWDLAWNICVREGNSLSGYREAKAEQGRGELGSRRFAAIGSIRAVFLKCFGPWPTVGNTFFIVTHKHTSIYMWLKQKFHGTFTITTCTSIMYKAHWYFLLGFPSLSLSIRADCTQMISQPTEGPWFVV